MRLLALLFLMLTPGLSSADEGAPGTFDYYVLSLSWSPNWCAMTGDARNSDQCDDRHDHGWTLHGLWPQYDTGYPSFCATGQRPPSRAMTAEMAEIMGSPGLAWYQWKKHGSCSGLSARAYFDISHRAYERINRPPVFRKLDRVVRLPAKVVEDAFLEANPSLSADMITITCKDGHIQEARVCLTRDLEPVACGADVARDCQMKAAVFAPVR
jgi:ribonuclease T2